MFRDPTIAGDWWTLCRRLDTSDALGRWSGSEAALSGIASVADLPESVANAAADPQLTDALIGALVRIGCRAGGDDADAPLVVVHLLADPLQVIACRLADLSPDMLPLLVGELCAQIRAWPMRRHRAYAANLLRDAQVACWRELRPHRTRTYPRGGDVLVDPHDTVATRVLLDRAIPGPDQDDDLDDILDWACRYRIAEPRDLALLVALERHRGYGTATRRRVADTLGVSERTLRRRRTRALAALRSAAPAYLDQSVASTRMGNNAGAGAIA